ncbi:MAG: hypothetical protein H6R10_956 [Rhodocyclaceae bacterium]|nr:hypothetical protein [Rhodocyclaceae bacterium]
MANENANPNDPMNFVRNMWGNMGFSLPGMVAPTFDVDELEKRIKDLKAVEGWLRMNLSMLQATIQGLEMQATTLSAVKAMGEMASNAAQQAVENAAQQAAQPGGPATPPPSEPAGPDAAGAFSQAAMWPWQLMQQMQEQLQQKSEQPKAAAATPPPVRKPAAKKPAAAKRPRKPAA